MTIQQQIKKIAKRIEEKYKPEKIILFGSYAWGKPTKDSDVDLLIIKNTEKKFFKRLFEVRQITDGEMPLDILVRTPSEVKKRLELGDFFYEDIINKGKFLYEKSKKY
jgi:uncharacterized protein